MPFQMPTGGGQLPPELGALIAQIIGGGGNKAPPPAPSPSRYAGGMPQGVTGGDTGAPAPPPGAPDLTGTQGNTPGGVQALVLRAMQALLGPGGQLSPGAPGAPSAMRQAAPEFTGAPSPQVGAGSGPPRMPGGGLPPPAAMPGDPASGATRAIRPGMSAADYANLLDPQKSLDRTLELQPGRGAPKGAPPPGASGSMIADAIARMVPPAAAGVPVTPGMVDPRLAPGGRPAPMPPGSPGYITRKIGRGETLSGIAGSNNPDKLRMIQAANPQIRDINRIVAGDTLNIPGQVVGVDRGSQNHPAMAGKKGQAPSATAKLKNKFLGDAQRSAPSKASGIQRVSGTRRY